MGNEQSNGSSNNNNNELVNQLQQQIMSNQLEIQRLQIGNLQRANQMNQINQLNNMGNSQENNANQGNIQFNSIFNNPTLQREISKNPAMKKQLLQKILNEYRNQMTQQQINKINQMLNSLPEPQQQNAHLLPNTNPQNFLTNIGTTNQNPQQRQSIVRQQKRSINTISQNYLSQEEKEQQEFELEQERRRQQFKEKQRQRRLEYETKLSQIENDNIDAYRLFQLDKNFTFDQLKKSYKKLAVKTHPDRPTGSKEKFQLVTKCYFHLLEKLKKQEQDKTFHQLRQSSQNYINNQQNNTQHNKQMQKLGRDNFNLRMFNKVFEEHKLYDPNDEGYEDWFKKDSTTQQPQIFSDKFNLDVFNSTFNNHKDSTTTEIMKYEEPHAMLSCNRMKYTEIGGANKGNFSKAPERGNDLSYTDLKSAYTKGDLINPNSVKYKTYRNVDELERDRANVSHEMTPEEMTRREMIRIREAEEEERRQERVRRQDMLSAEQYQRIHQNMLGYARGPDLSR
jgi:curved DNA-binding protein CbpA